MNTQVEDLGNSQVQLTVEVEQQRVEKAMKQAARRLARDINVPGFRKGKAPYHVIAQRVGPLALIEEAANDIWAEVLGEALEEQKIEVFGFNHIAPEITQLEPLTFRFLVPTAPVIKLGDLSAITIELQESTVEEEQVDEVLANLREARATLEPTLGPAQYADHATLNLRGDLMDGTTVEEEEGMEITLAEPPELEEDAEPRPEPDLASQIVGMMVNQVKEVPIVYPESWEEPRLRGRTVLYKVTLLDLKRPVEPELDDEFAREVGDFDTLDALRQRIRSNMLAEAEDEEFNRRIEALLDAMVEEAELSYPPFLIEEEIHRRVQDFERQLQAYRIPLENYLQVMGLEQDEFEDNFRDTAETFIERSLVLSQYVRDNDFAVSEEEMERELGVLLQSYDAAIRGNLRDRIRDSETDMDQIRDRLLTRKAIFHLYEQVTGEEAPPLFPAVPEEEDVEENVEEDSETMAEQRSAPAITLAPYSAAEAADEAEDSQSEQDEERNA